jgi:two-component system, NarL family, response regulator NreC
MSRRKEALRILVVDDHPVVREGIRMCLKDRDDVEVVAEAADGKEAIEQVRSVEPDIVLLDLTMPRMGGLEALPGIRRARRRTRVIVVTVHNTREYLRQAMAARVDGYLLKDTAPAEYIEAIRSVIAGRVFVSPAVTREAEKETHALVARKFNLAAREVEYLSLAAKGLRGSEIASAMKCGATAVRSYQRRVLGKLGFTNMAMLTRFAVEQGL